ncbi:MAG: LysR family transcriptional regulator [Firmicutes bacterium]|nr:LysR family transcriptional regulator [Bacillota bacterium]
MAKFIGATEAAEIMSVSRSTAYRIIKRLNDELDRKGYITIAGKVSRKYFLERLYGGEEELYPKAYEDNNQRVA